MIVRIAAETDLEELLDVQQEGAIAALSHIFPQDRYPFPRAELLCRWRREIRDPDTEVFLSTDEAGAVTGFAAVRDEQFLHFGTARHTWGSGLAAQLHGAMLQRFAAHGVQTARLFVFAENHRARRFYTRMGWRPTGIRQNTSFPPHPELLEYALRLNRDAG